MFGFLLVGLFVTCACYFYSKFLKFKSINAPSPKCRWPLIGHFCDFIGASDEGDTNSGEFKKCSFC